jgi:hypothetical protein
MAKTFIGYDSLYELHDPLLDEPYRGRFDLSLESVFPIVTGSIVPPEPVAVHRAMGGDLWEVIWADQMGPLAVSHRVVELLRAHGFSGWSTYPVLVFDPERGVVPGYYGLAVTGRCGPIDYGRSQLDGIDTVLPDYVGLYFDPDSWDGSDLFFADRGRPFCTAEVKTALDRADVRNIAFTPLPKVRTPQIAVDDFPKSDVR